VDEASRVTVLGYRDFDFRRDEKYTIHEELPRYFGFEG
jgi:hypothetical protein